MAFYYRDILRDFDFLTMQGYNQGQVRLGAWKLFMNRVNLACMIRQERERRRSNPQEEENGICWATSPLTIPLFFFPTWNLPGLPAPYLTLRPRRQKARRTGGN